MKPQPRGFEDGIFADIQLGSVFPQLLMFWAELFSARALGITTLNSVLSEVIVHSPLWQRGIGQTA